MNISHSSSLLFYFAFRLKPILILKPNSVGLFLPPWKEGYRFIHHASNGWADLNGTFRKFSDFYKLEKKIIRPLIIKREIKKLKVCKNK
jgi:hypothetical protein